VALRRALTAALLLLAAARAEAQVLTIGETLGKGKNGILVSENVLVPGDDIPNLNNAFVQYARGLSDRFDLYLAAGGTTTEGSTQAWLGGGGLVRLARMGKASLAFFSLASVPLNHRDQACLVLWNPALVVSAPVNAKLTVYSGLNSLVPIGERERGNFTPPSTKANVPIGATVALGAWGLWGEADFGTLNAVGVGVTRIW
jgi:hypothetical protein